MCEYTAFAFEDVHEFWVSGFEFDLKSYLFFWVDEAEAFSEPLFGGFYRDVCDWDFFSVVFKGGSVTDD